MLQVSPGRALWLGGMAAGPAAASPASGSSRAARGASGITGTAKAAPPAPRQSQGNACSPRAAPQAQPLGSEAGQGSAARVPTEPALPGCGLASTLVRWSKDPAGSTAREWDAQGAPTRSQAVVPRAAQTRPVLQAAPPHHSQAGARSPAEGNFGTHHAISAPQPRVVELLFHPGAQPKPQERHLGQSCEHQPQLSLQLLAPSHVICCKTASLEPSLLSLPAARRAAAATAPSTADCTVPLALLNRRGTREGNQRCIGWKEPLECSAPTASTLRSALASWGLNVSKDGLSNSSKLVTFFPCVKQSLHQIFSSPRRGTSTSQQNSLLLLQNTVCASPWGWIKLLPVVRAAGPARAAGAAAFTGALCDRATSELSGSTRRQPRGSRGQGGELVPATLLGKQHGSTHSTLASCTLLLIKSRLWGLQTLK